ncbi:MAG: AAA family ATPase [Hyphomonadaceae bacterium]
MSTPTPPLAPIVLPVMRPADMAALPVKARRWIVQDVIPEGEPTLVYGKGATGKSLLLFQLAICIASGRKWVDREVPHGRAVFFTCEDGVDELNRRGASVLKMLGIDWSDCGERLLIIPMRGAEADAVLATPNSNGTLTPTGTYEALKAVVGDFRPDLVVVDTLADTFAGDENRRAEAKQFVNMIARLRIDATHVVTAHPSVSAEADGRGSSGSTGWPAAVRSHLTFSRIKDGKYKADGDVRLLENKKGNYAAEGAGAILMRWKEGAFVPESGSAELSEADVDALFLALLHKYHGTGRRISAHMAPSTFAKEAEAVAAGVTKAKLDAAKHRLFDAQRIGQEPSKGSNGRESTRLVILDVGGPMPWRPAQD